MKITKFEIIYSEYNNKHESGKLEFYILSKSTKWSAIMYTIYFWKCNRWSLPVARLNWFIQKNNCQKFRWLVKWIEYVCLFDG